MTPPGEVVDAIHHPREDVDWGEDSPREAERIALALHGLYCRNIAPARNYVAVEATCERLEITDLGLALTGTTDRITTNALGDLGIADIKTGKTAVAADGTVRTAGHAAQIGVYELLAGAAIGQPITAPAEIIGLQVAKTDQGPAAPPWASSPAPRAAGGHGRTARPAPDGRPHDPQRRLLRQSQIPDLYRKILPGVPWMPVEEMT